MKADNNTGSDYPMWVDAPRAIDITTKQFYNLSYYGLAALWCSFKALFYRNKDGSMMMYTHDPSLANICNKSKRFKGIDWFENSAAEMYLCTIPGDSELITIIEKRFKHLIMEGYNNGY